MHKIICVTTLPKISDPLLETHLFFLFGISFVWFFLEEFAVMNKSGKLDICQENVREFWLAIFV